MRKGLAPFFLFCFGPRIRAMGKTSCYAILLLGGSGERFGAALPKQFLPILGKPMFCHALEVLEASPEIDKIVLVSRNQDIAKVHGISSKAGYQKIFGIVEGGATRQDSVFNGLNYLKERKISPSAIVLIQDADRPALTLELIQANIEACKKEGAAITAMPASDTLMLGEDGKATQYLPRKASYQIQTPQTFVFSLIFEAHEKAKKEGISGTDDGFLVFHQGHPVAIVENGINPKITTPEDLKMYLGLKGGE